MAVFLATCFLLKNNLYFSMKDRYLVTSVSYWICIFHLINNALDNRDDIFLQKKNMEQKFEKTKYYKTDESNIGFIQRMKIK